jgi:hypothetical protein
MYYMSAASVKSTPLALTDSGFLPDEPFAVSSCVDCAPEKTLNRWAFALQKPVL